MQDKSAIKRFPDSPGAAVNADTANAEIKTTIAASAMMAMSCLIFFFIVRYRTFKKFAGWSMHKVIIPANI